MYPWIEVCECVGWGGRERGARQVGGGRSGANKAGKKLRLIPVGKPQFASGKVR